jgi:hypothetical protein
MQYPRVHESGSTPSVVGLARSVCLRGLVSPGPADGEAAEAVVASESADGPPRVEKSFQSHRVSPRLQGGTPAAV